MIRLCRADSVKVGDVVRLPDMREERVVLVEQAPGVVTIHLADGMSLECGQDQMVRLTNCRRL